MIPARQVIGILFLFLFGLALPATGAEDAPAGPPLVIQLGIEGAIGPATSDYVIRSLEQASRQHAALAVLRVDTPGGLDVAMRDIIKQIIAAPMPVATYVAPGGARAASAGTYILYASHFAAMAPGTNLGAATPVQIGLPGGVGDEEKPTKEKPSKPGQSSGTTMERKMVNDAVAYIRGLAILRGRNADWAEKAVRESASLPAEEALNLKVIDAVAPDVESLLHQVDGRQFQINGANVKLNLAGAQLIKLDPDWRSRLLAAIGNPNIAYILMLLGIYGLILELYHPGAVAPGTLGAICLLLALYAFQALPVNYAGVALILLGIGLMIGEAFAPSFGILGLGGVSAFAIGSVILMDTEVPGLQLDPALIAAFTLCSGAFFIWLTGLVIKARREPVVSGREALLGSVGTVMGDFDGTGRVRLNGEIWFARAEGALRNGQRIVVKDLDGLILVVAPLNAGD